ncbi:GATOR complex protein WDR59 isoform X2 [Folsomia candida]|uniref:GATOR complex protein WDR59 isoform X2 n=1 Tax=Folsomia candida TaxID=158441 RepID=UPI000B9047CC|nr:GATOR complex protein WDR59 isoform X2 [Folsomia candida]
MANRYGSESFAIEFRDLQATTLCLDKTGNFALLAGRKYLAVLGLEETSTDKLLVRVPYGGKYEISSAQWCKGEDKQVAIASSQRCDIYELTDAAELKCAIRLKGHTRVITDLDWCSLNPSLLASSSFDSYVHIWDIRARNSGSADKPQFSLSALDGASQVRWNRVCEDILASCDGGHVKIWDLRKPNTPSEFIAAHASKINGLEWANSDTVITAAQDCTVKFSKLSDNKGTSASNKGPILSLTAPVWRARPAPFGRGVVTQCVPILRRDSGLLSLWDWKQHFASPIFTFQAYDIIEFAWRKTKNYDLITWSRDQTLRVWTLPREIVQLCGGDDEENPIRDVMSTSHDQATFIAEEDEETTEAGVELAMEEDLEVEEEEQEQEESPPPTPQKTSTPTSTMTIRNKRTAATLERGNRSRKSSSPSPLNRRDFLKAEFEKVEQEKPENINFDQIELDKGLIRFSWSSKSKPGENKVRGVTAGILASFANGYPAVSPTFLVTNASSEVDKNDVVKSLKNLALHYSKKNEQCLAKCVEQFCTIMSSIKTLEDIEEGYFGNVRGVSNVPFPRTSGARFCAVGMLVCFGRPSYLKRVKSNCDAGTPRSLSALGPYLSQVALENEDIFRHRDRRHHHNHHRPRHDKKRAGLVTLFDVSPLLPFNLKLAEDYKHIVPTPGHRKAACDINLSVSFAQKKHLVANIWQAAGIISTFASPEEMQNSRNGDDQYGNGIVVGSELIPAAAINDMTFEEEEEINWLAYHPLGCELIHMMITHSAQFGDVQTAATLAGLFTSKEHLPSVGSDYVGQFKKGGGGQGHRQTVPGTGSPYHTVHGSDTHGIVGGFNYNVNPLLSAETFFRQHRSNSWSDSLDDIKTLQLLHGVGEGPMSNGGTASAMSTGGGGGGGDGPSYHSSSGGIQIQGSNKNNTPNKNGGRGGHSHHGGGGGVGGGVISDAATNGAMMVLANNNNNIGDAAMNGDGSAMVRLGGTVVCISKQLIPVGKGVVLDGSLHRFYDRYKKSYAEILFRWGLLQQRAEILKNLTEISESNTITRMGVDFSILCRSCGETSKTPYCFHCKRIVSICSICHTPAKGLSTFCPLCGHGGHANHVLSWFTDKKVCPAGCGCLCITEIRCGTATPLINKTRSS